MPNDQGMNEIAALDAVFLDTGVELDDKPDCVVFVGAGCHSGNTDVRLCVSQDTGAPEGGELEPGPFVGAGTCTVAPAPGWVPVLCILFVWFRRCFMVLCTLGLFSGGDALALDVQHFQTLEGGNWAALREADFGEKYALGVVYGMNYARAPLSEIHPDGSGARPVIRGLMSAELAGTVNVGAVQAGFGMPYHVVNFAEEPTVADLGDMAFWLGLRLPIPDELHHLSLSARVEGFSGVKYVSGTAAILTAAYEARSKAWAFAFNAGVRLQKEEERSQYEWGRRGEYGAGLSWERQRFGLKLEWIGSVPLYRMAENGQFPMEILIGVHGDPVKGVRVHAGLGRGLAGGIGSPHWRVYSMIEVRPDVKKDNDRDGLVNLTDRCPNKPEDKDGFRDRDGCPDLDNDRDGIADLKDMCPMKPETFNDYADGDGCPDKTGFVRVQVIGAPRDSFSTARLTVGSAEAMNVLEGEVTQHAIEGEILVVTAEADGHRNASVVVGLEEDGDTTVAVLRLSPGAGPDQDTINVCPNNETPPCITTEGNQIRNQQPIGFEWDSMVLTESARATLQKLARYLNDHPEIELLRVEGYADEFGGSRYNYELSKRRAETVAAYLVSLGVQEERLAPLATGEALRTHRTESLRRVEFTVLVWNDLDGKAAPMVLVEPAQ